MSRNDWLDAATSVILSFRDAGWPACAMRAALFQAGRFLSRKQRDSLLAVVRACYGR